jgi:hypothetical protein
MNTSLVKPLSWFSLLFALWCAAGLALYAMPRQSTPDELELFSVNVVDLRTPFIRDVSRVRCDVFPPVEPAPLLFCLTRDVTPEPSIARLPNK